MVFHVKLLLVSQMIINGTFAKYRVDSIMLAKENVAEDFLSLELFQLFRDDFFAKLVHEAV
jgi:hypothetical protein